MDDKQSETRDEFRYPKIKLSQSATKRLPVASQLLRNGSGKGVLQSTHRFDSIRFVRLGGVSATSACSRHVLASNTDLPGSISEFHIVDADCFKHGREKIV